MANFILAHKKVQASEGGYSNNPNDSGNYVDGILIGSNYGISAPTLKNYLGKRPTREEMINLSPKVALVIYKNEYWNRIKGDEIKNQSVAHLIYDSAVNQGYSFTRRAIQNAVEEQGKKYVVIDSNQINNLNQKKFFDSIFKQRLDRYSTGKKEFRKGWINRLNEIKFISQKKITYYLVGGLLLVTTLTFIILNKLTK